MTRIPIALLSLLFAGSLFADSAQVDFVASVQNPLSTTMAVTNHGPDVARNSVITVDIPPGLVLQRLDRDGRGLRSLAAAGALLDWGPCGRRSSERRFFALHGGRFHGAVRRCDVRGDVHGLVRYARSQSFHQHGVRHVHHEAGGRPRRPGHAAVQPSTVSSQDNPRCSRHYVGNNVRNNKPPNVRVDYAVTNGVIEKIDAPPAASCSISRGHRGLYDRGAAARVLATLRSPSKRRRTGWRGRPPCRCVRRATCRRRIPPIIRRRTSFPSIKRMP